MQLNPQRRSAILLTIIIVSMLAVSFWRYTGIPFPKLQVRILIVVFGGVAGVMNLYRGILLGFSRHAGWGVAAVPLLWAGVMLIVSYNALAPASDHEKSLPLSVLAAVMAIGASLLAQRTNERSDTG